MPAFRYGDVRPYAAKTSLVRLFERASRRLPVPRRIHFGALLTGGAHIACAAYRDHLVTALTRKVSDRIVGGEMEGQGLIGLSAPEDPQWCLIKAICDFGDERRDEEAPARRADVCHVAARFVLEAFRDEALVE